MLTPLPAEIAPLTEAQGAAIQHALASIANALPPFGFKIGATGRRMQEYLGIDAPIAGFMEGKDVYPGHADLRFADYIRPGVECEVAVRLARDLPPGPCSAEQALAAVGDFVAGIEIVENRYGDLKQLGTPTLVADQMYHAAAVIGDQGQVDWRTLDIGALRGSISLADGTQDSGVTTDLLGHPLNGLALARGIAGGRGVWRPEGGAGHHAGQRYSAHLADRAGDGYRRVPAAAAGDASGWPDGPTGLTSATLLRVSRSPRSAR